MIRIVFMIYMLGPKSTEFNSLWVGDRLLPLANACINSFKGHGHQFKLYTYDAVEYVPEFVERRDGEEIMTSANIFRAHGWLETFADEFHYQGQIKMCTWC